MTKTLCYALFSLAVLAPVSAHAQAVTFTVNSTADTDDGTCDFAHCSLREAINAANANAGLDTIALLGTRFTMEKQFYKGRLQEHGLDVIVPEEPDLTTVHDVIYDELVQGRILDTSRNRYLEIIDRLVDRGARGVIAGCTEIELLVTAEDIDLPYFPTTALHAMAAVEAALQD